RTSVHGYVRNAATGEPLARALVRIEGDAETGALTDGSGRFELEGVPVGPQTFRLRKPGFHDRLYASEEMGYESDGPAHNVLVVAGMGDLEFTLAPAPSIHGRVELTTGDPAVGLEVVLLEQMVRNGRAVWTQTETTKTNSQGGYRFAGLAEGVYALATLPAFESEPVVTAIAAGRGAAVTRAGYPNIYYPQAREFSGATHIRLGAGDQMEANMLLPLETFSTVTATALLPGGHPFSGAQGEGFFQGVTTAKILDSTGRALPYPCEFDQATHSFQASLPDGIYTLSAGALVNDPDRSRDLSINGGRMRGQTMLTGFAEFAVEGKPIANLHVPLGQSPGWPIHLRVAQNSSPALQARAGSARGLQDLVTVTANQAGGPGLSGEGGAEEQTAAEAGPDLLLLTMSRSVPMWLSTQVNDRSVCLDSFIAGSVNLAREPLSVPMGGSAPPMELMLRDDCARLSLELPAGLSAFLPGDEPFYTVYIVPEFDTTADIPPMTIHPSSGRTLEVSGLTPGSYRVYTFREPIRLEYRNPAALSALPAPGQQISLSAGAQGQLVLEVPAR
ncbi:MAG: carboxypeptidase-like regulatory domain-containing protein, partial [Terracidiphilus sp.]